MAKCLRMERCSRIAALMIVLIASSLLATACRSQSGPRWPSGAGLGTEPVSNTATLLKWPAAQSDAGPIVYEVDTSGENPRSTQSTGLLVGSLTPNRVYDYSVTPIDQLKRKGSPIRASMATGRPKIVTDQDLIDEAVRAHRIDEQTATVYSIYSAFRDPRLPTQYRGKTAGFDGTSAMVNALARFPQLSDASRADIRPYLLPPTDPHSWLAQGGSQLSPSATFGKRSYDLRTTDSSCNPILPLAWRGGYKATYAGFTARVWYRRSEDLNIASHVAAQVQVRILPALFDNIRMKHPISTRHPLCVQGDDDLDIFMTPLGDPKTEVKGGVTMPPLDDAFSETFGIASSSVIVLNSGLPEDQVDGAAAHELMHASQFAYNRPVAFTFYSKIYWWEEATAVFATNAVYPSPPHYWERLSYRADRIARSLDDPHQSVDDTYAAFTWPLFLAKKYGNAVIGSIWGLVGEGRDVVDAVEAVVPNAVENGWGDYSDLYYNRSVVNAFHLWADAEGTQFTDLSLQLGEQPKASVRLSGGIPPLAAGHYFFTLDDRVRELKITYGAPHGIGIHAMKLNPDDAFNAEPAVVVSDEGTYCLDQPGDPLYHAKFVLFVVANHSWGGAANPFDASGVDVEGRDSCHELGAKGTLKTERNESGSEVLVDGTHSFTAQGTSTVQFSYVQDRVFPNGGIEWADRGSMLIESGTRTETISCRYPTPHNATLTTTYEYQGPLDASIATEPAVEKPPSPALVDVYMFSNDRPATGTVIHSGVDCDGHPSDWNAAYNGGRGLILCNSVDSSRSGSYDPANGPIDPEPELVAPLSVQGEQQSPVSADLTCANTGSYNHPENLQMKGEWSMHTTGFLSFEPK